MGLSVKRILGVAVSGLLAACATVEPIDCAQFPPFGPDAGSDDLAISERRELLSLGRSYSSPDRVAMAAAYANLEDYRTAFEMADRPGGSGSEEEAYLAIATVAADQGALDTALLAAEPISYSRNLARSNLAIAVAQGKAGLGEAAQASFGAARDANSNMVRQYAYHSLLSWEFAESGEFAKAIEEAGRIDDSYWGYRAHAMVRIAWEQYEAGDVSAAAETLRQARSEIGRAEYASPRYWTKPDMQFLLAEVFFQIGEYRESADLLVEASDHFASELYQAGDFDRLSASLLWADLAEATGQSQASRRANELRQQALQNLIVDDRTIGVPSILHWYSKTELVRWLIDNGRSEWVYETQTSLDDADARISLGVSIAHAEASRGNPQQAVAVAQAIDDWRGKCFALILTFAEMSEQERAQDAMNVANIVNAERCYRLSSAFPDVFYGDLAANAAKVGDRVGSCRALEAIGTRDVWLDTIARIADARAAKGDVDGVLSVVRWAYSSGNIDGTEASRILAAIAATRQSDRNPDDVFPPVLGTTEAFADLQRVSRRYSVWYEDGIWDQ